MIKFIHFTLPKQFINSFFLKKMYNKNKLSIAKNGEEIVERASG